VTRIISEETDISVTDVTKKGGLSNIVVEPVRKGLVKKDEV
jgi:hypothetical protein